MKRYLAYAGALAALGGSSHVVSENGLSESKIGLRGTNEFFEGWSGVFRLETGINPLSGNLSDGVKSITQNNGVPLGNRTALGDSSRAGQPFQGAAYGGVSSPVYGTLTIGRQNGLLLDNVLKYDPLGGLQALRETTVRHGSIAQRPARTDNPYAKLL